MVVVSDVGEADLRVSKATEELLEKQKQVDRMWRECVRCAIRVGEMKNAIIAAHRMADQLLDDARKSIAETERRCRVKVSKLRDEISDLRRDKDSRIRWLWDELRSVRRENSWLREEYQEMKEARGSAVAEARSTRNHLKGENERWLKAFAWAQQHYNEQLVRNSALEMELEKSRMRVKELTGVGDDVLSLHDEALSIGVGAGEEEIGS